MSNRGFITLVLVHCVLLAGNQVWAAQKPGLRHRILLGSGEDQGGITLIDCDPPPYNGIDITEYTGFRVTLEEANCAARNQFNEELPEDFMFTDDVTQDVGKSWQIGPYSVWQSPLVLNIYSRSRTPGYKYPVIETLEDGWRLYFEDWIDMDCNDVVALVRQADVISLEFYLPAGATYIPYEDEVENVRVRASNHWGAPVADFGIELSRAWKCNTGGHSHCPGPDDPLTFDPESGDTDFNGDFWFSVSASEYCGEDSMKAQGIARPEVIGSRETEIRHPDPLVPMPGGNYRLTGGTACHLAGDNHYALAYVTTQLHLIAEDYLGSDLAVPPSSDHICYNDMSLKWGGKFAIDCSWTGDHQYHHRGRNCDMEQGCVPDPNEEGLERIIESHGGSVQKIPGHHWHLTF